MTELSKFAKSSTELMLVEPGTFKAMVEQNDMYYLLLSVIDFNQMPGKGLVKRELMGFPHSRNEQKVMLNLLKFEYESQGYSWEERDSRLYRGFEVMDGGRSIAMITAFKAKEEIEDDFD